MLDKLLKKAESTSSKIWKWLLGIFIAIGAFILTIKLKNAKNKVVKLQAESVILKSKAKDMVLDAKEAEHRELADIMRKEAAKLVVDSQEMKLEAEKVERYVEKTRSLINQAKAWREIEDLAKGK